MFSDLKKRHDEIREEVWRTSHTNSIKIDLVNVDIEYCKKAIDLTEPLLDDVNKLKEENKTLKEEINAQSEELKTLKDEIKKLHDSLTIVYNGQISKIFA